MAEQHSVVITGAAIASPAGFSLLENLSAIWSGKSNFREITRFDTAGTAIRYGGQCGTVDTKIFPDQKLRKSLTEKDLISLSTLIRAGHHARLIENSYNPERFGVFVGAGSTQIGDLTPYFLLVKSCVDEALGGFDSQKFGAQLLDTVNPMVVMQTLLNNSLCFGSRALDARGVNGNYMDFEVSGLRAIGEAFRNISEGRADVAMAGGVAATLEPFNLLESYHEGLFARSNAVDSNPETIAKPYDGNRCGGMPSEGAAYVVLEREDLAKARGATIYARLVGYGLNSDAAPDLKPDPMGAGLSRAMKSATEDAKIAANDLGFIVGHGSGARRSDAAECEAYTRFLGNTVDDVAIGSPKGVFGEMQEASGVVGLILAMDAMAKRKIPATYNFEHPDAASGRLNISGGELDIRADFGAITAVSRLGLSGCLIVTPGDQGLSQIKESV